jgi:hypothetical protein
MVTSMNVDSFLGMSTWIIRFMNGGIKMGMILSLWNNFLQPLLCSVVVRSNHDERIGIIIMLLMLMLIFFVNSHADVDEY